VKSESQLKSEVAGLIANKLRMLCSQFRCSDLLTGYVIGMFVGTISKGDINRMVYKSFKEQITRKHGIVIEGWLLSKFENPSAIGSQVELRTLFNAWQSGAACFRKMSEGEFLTWISEQNEGSPPDPPTAAAPSVATVPPSSHGHVTHTSPSTSATPAFNFIEFSPASATPPVSTQKKARKTRSDKGKSQKQGLQLPGELVFPATQ